MTKLILTSISMHKCTKVRKINSILRIKLSNTNTFSTASLIKCKKKVAYQFSFNLKVSKWHKLYFFSIKK